MLVDFLYLHIKKQIKQQAVRRWWMVLGAGADGRIMRQRVR
jgi:hypothetical protein